MTDQTPLKGTPCSINFEEHDGTWRLRCSCNARSGWTTLEEVERIGRAHLGHPPTKEDMDSNIEARAQALGGPSSNPLFAPNGGRTNTRGMRQFNDLDDGLAASGR